MPRLRTTVLALSLLAFLVSCGGAPTESPTPDSEALIATAEAEAQMTRAAVTPTAPPTRVTPTLTSAPVTPTVTSTPAPTGPAATAAYNANIRSGPGVEYDVIDAFYQGQAARLAGRYVNGLGELWWYVLRIGPGLAGWVWDGAVVVTGDVSGVPFLEPPPTPTPVPAPTATPTPTATTGP